LGERAVADIHQRAAALAGSGAITMHGDDAEDRRRGRRARMPVEPVDNEHVIVAPTVNAG